VKIFVRYLLGAVESSVFNEIQKYLFSLLFFLIWWTRGRAW